MLGFDRRYVLIPILLSIVLLVSAFVMDQDAQRRLAASTQRVQEQLRRVALLNNLMQMVVEAESGQRGYLLTGEPSFLVPYQSAVDERDMVMSDLQRVYEAQDPAFAEPLQAIEQLTADELNQLDIGLKLKQKTGDAAVEFTRTGIGRTTMTRLRDAVATMRGLENDSVPALIAAQHRDLLLTRGITAAGLLIDVILVVLAGLLVSREIRRRVVDAQRLLEERNALESVVAARTADLSALSSHLQLITEQEKSALARELHDELGSMLVSAKMDVTWLRRKLRMEEEDCATRWQRILGTLDAGVDLKRRVVEQLRPTLLDNMGLLTALRWQLQESCGRAGLRCTEHLPASEPQLSSVAAIAIFRVAQEAMTNVIKHAHATAVELAVLVDAEHLTLTLTDDGVGVPPARLKASGSHGLLGMRHRVQALGGSWRLLPGPDGRGTEVWVQIPLAQIKVPHTDPIPEAVAL
jgi:signal transduction histidine kinase